MVRGNEAKQRIFAKLLEVFPGSFMQDDKILRIIESENGSTVEIKVTLTAAKDIMGASRQLLPPISGPTAVDEFDWSDNSTTTGGKSSVEAAAAADLSETEKENIRKMMEALGL